MTKLLKASLILATPLMFAAYGDRDNGSSAGASISVGAEGFVNVINVGWGATTTAAAEIDFVHNASNYVYTEAHDKMPNYSFGGAVIARTDLTDDFSALFRFGFEAGMSDATSVGATATPDRAGTSTWKSKMVMAPGAFLGYKGLYVGAVYDMRGYEISGHNAASASLNTTAKENQILFGLRGETLYSMEDMHLTVAFEGLSNFGAKADSDIETYFTTLTDVGAGAAATTVHTNFTKLSLSLGMMFADF